MKIPNLSALPVTVPTNPAFSRRKHVIFTLATGLLFYASPFAPLRGQPLLDAFNPNVTGGLIRTIAAQPDGKIVIGGNFTTVGTTARTRLARLNANGSLDTTFPNTVANGEVFSLALQADGKIVVGGAFSTLGGQPHSFLGRLNSDGTLDNAFTVGANDWVRAVAVQIDGKILVGGAFTNLAGQSRPYLGRVNADGTLDSFNPQADNQVNTISVQTDGTIVVGGFFTALGGQPRNRLGQLTSAGGVILDFDPNVNGAVWSLALDRNSGIIVGGLFTSVQTQPRTNLARLFLSGSVDSTFKPPTDSTVASLAVQPDGKIVAGGNFTNLFGQTNKFIGRLNADGSVDATFTNLGANATVYSLATQPDGKILAGGGFTTLGGQTRNGMARFGQSLASPANDAFASATVLQLANRSLSFSGSNLGATFETGESNFLASAFGGRSVWYSYTPSEQGLLRVLLTSPTCCQNESAYSLLVARGSSAANLTAVTVPILIDNGALFTRTRAAYADVLQGLDHRIVVDGGFWNGIFVGSNFNVRLQLFPSPTNDNFQQRYHIPGRSYATLISLLAASREPGEPSHGGGAGSLWWDWTAPFTGLVTLRGTQAGNFVPFLAVYQGAVLASLASAPSSSQVIGQTRQLRFQATQGQNYDLALAGAKFDTNDFPHISDALFSSGKFEFSFATLAIQMTSLSATTNSTNGVDFSTTTRVQNFGPATSGPLRLRMIAKPGVSETEQSSGQNELSDTKIELTVFNLPPPGQVAPGLSAPFTVGGTCPAPIFDPANRGTGTGFEVFCVLEERVGTNWLLQDKLMVLQGVWPVVSGFGGPGAGIIRLDPGLESMAYDELLSVQILGRSPIDEGTKAAYTGRATFAVATPLDFTNTTWTATRFTITNGVFQTGIVTNDTTVGIGAQYSYAGLVNNASRNITVRNLPSPLLAANTIKPYLPFKFSVRGVLDRQHVVERTTNLGPTAFWIPLVTNKASNVSGSFGTFTFSDPRSTSLNPASSFYRVREFE